MGTIPHADVVGANIHASKEAPNIFKNGGLQNWTLGTSSQPDNLVDEGTPDVLRDTGESDNWNSTPYSVKYTATGAANEGGKYTFSNLKATTKYGVHVRAKATAGDTARILTTEASTNIDTETVLTDWTSLYGTFETNATPTDVVLKLVAKGDGDIVWFCKIMVVEGDVIPTFAPRVSDITSVNTVTSASTLTDNALVRGDGGLKGVQTSGIIVDDSDNVTGINDLSVSGTLTLQNTGLHILDTNASHDLIIKPGSDLTADKTLTLATGDADRTVTLSGNPTLSDWFNQSVKTTASPEFAPAGNAITIQNTTDVFSNQVAIFKSGNRGTPDDGDEGYVSLYNDDSTGTQVEFSRLSWVATDVTNTTKDSRLTLSTMVNNSLTAGMSVVGQSIGVGTFTPGIDLAESTGDLTGNYLHVKDTTNAAGLIVEGTSGGATLNLIDLGAGANNKYLKLTVDGGVAKWVFMNDDSSTVRMDNIMVVNVSAPVVSFGTATPGRDLAGDTSDLVSGRGLHIKDTAAGARLIVEGDTAHLDMISLGGTANNKWLRFSMGSNNGVWEAINDDGTVKTSNILLIRGAGGIQTNTLELSSGSITDQTGAISFGNENLVTTGTLGCGAITATGNIIIPNSGNIGSVSDTDAITIASNGRIGFSDTPDSWEGTAFGASLQALGGMGVRGGTPFFVFDESDAAANNRLMQIFIASGFFKINRFNDNGGGAVDLFSIERSTGAIFMPNVWGDIISSGVRDLQIQDDGQLGYVFSSIRYKTHIRRNLPDIETSWIHDVEIVKWDSKDGKILDELSPIAEEMVNINRAMVGFGRIKGAVQKNGKDVYYPTDEPETIVKSRFIFPMLMEIQKLRRDLDTHINA